MADTSRNRNPQIPGLSPVQRIAVIAGIALAAASPFFAAAEISPAKETDVHAGNSASTLEATTNDLIWG
ncbi:hypothetical protein [Streptomyces viridochromogenes]|uniref:hypothetical protein n=1 Tax=Streptomyces viridochromogenes TaxID=1938 RepID=UPI00069D29A2|nr:hypothetical protein [Streptomyces viridochromogenes]KOG08644.1 hypothetical protein ADK35_41345 [Streptomyces viridochromogenes]KOG08677.1 hypothetical protein ADK36_42295 [Streptomyces viridochromogenes]